MHSVGPVNYIVGIWYYFVQSRKSTYLTQEQILAVPRILGTSGELVSTVTHRILSLTIHSEINIPEIFEGFDIAILLCIKEHSVSKLYSFSVDVHAFLSGPWNWFHQLLFADEIIKDG